MIKREIEKIIKDCSGEDGKVEKPISEHGDYASSVAFDIAKKEKRNPNQIAEELKDKIKSELFEKVEVKGGFLNFFIAEDALKKEISLILEQKEEYGRGNKEKTVVVDYSSPNIAKPFGIGHLRSTIIGQAIYNIYNFWGWKTIGVNHLGDWGTQYGKIICQIKKENLDPEKLSIKELEAVYVRFHKEADEDPEIEKEGREWFHKLERGDEEAVRMWEICRKKSIEEFNKIYQKLGVAIDHTTGESFYQDKIQAVIDEAVEKKVAVESEGALVVHFQDMPSVIIQKSDESTTYLARDLSAVKYRLETFSPDLFIYEVGAEQTLYMKQLFATVEKLGWAKKEQFVHMAHGLFRLKDGKLSTRKGKTIHLEEVLSLAEEKAKKIIEDSLSSDLTEQEKEKISETVAMGAVKYNGLKSHHRRDVVFDWDRVLALKGDSGPYLQYTCVRCKRVLEKAGEGDFSETEKFNENERKLALRLVEFKEVVEVAGETFSPNIIADYAHRLAKDFNLLYEGTKIVGSKKRIVLTKATKNVLTTSLSLLTVSLPDKM
ncbi:MAG: arginine--tRNA ligase [Candidatus Pacebacteria bacterium]|nr:arginine--tRNA ligase [Candidatus Paceibacterota bacterium]